MKLAAGTIGIFFILTAFGFFVASPTRPSYAEAPATQVPIATPTSEEVITPVPKPSRGTELRLVLRDLDGKIVKPTKAELYLFAWNINDRIALHIEDNQVILLLDDDWRRSDAAHGFDVTGADYRIYIEADGYAPIQSKPFWWLAMFGGLRDSATVEFPENPPLGISAGEKRSFNLLVHKSWNRRLKLINDQGNPVADARVSTYAFHENENHCGVISESHLADGITDAQGLVSIPGGDFEYDLEIKKPYYAVTESSYFDRLITYLRAEETVVRLHKLSRRLLNMVVTREGKPAADMELRGDLAGCGCCYGYTIARTDEHGRIQLGGFYPEQWDLLFFRDEHDNQLWESEPKYLFRRPGKTIVVLKP